MSTTFHCPGWSEPLSGGPLLLAPLIYLLIFNSKGITCSCRQLRVQPPQTTRLPPSPLTSSAAESLARCGLCNTAQGESFISSAAERVTTAVQGADSGNTVGTAGAVRGAGCRLRRRAAPPPVRTLVHFPRFATICSRGLGLASVRVCLSSL